MYSSKISTDSLFDFSLGEKQKCRLVLFVIYPRQDKLIINTKCLVVLKTKLTTA
jgi:hypothetical protein